MLLYAATVIAAPINGSMICSSTENVSDTSNKVGESLPRLEVSIVAIILTISVRQIAIKNLSQPHYWLITFILFLTNGTINSWGLFTVLKVLTGFSELGQFDIMRLFINYMLLMPFCAYTCLVGYLNTALANSEIYQVPFYALCELVIFLGQNDLPAAQLILSKYGDKMKELTRGNNAMLERCSLESIFYEFMQTNETEVEHPQPSAICVRKHRLRKHNLRIQGDALLQGFTLSNPVVLGHHPFTSWLDRTSLCPKKHCSTQ